ncbi:hypothetical protein DFQ26_000374 [Actinomortierella ambigua]|nr:hypothetical protein DFQ26_000374 [Actinomortierella ambigua]
MAATTLDNQPMPAWSKSNPRRFLGDDDRLREFSSFFTRYFDSTHPQHDPADTGATHLMHIDEPQHPDVFNRVAAEFRQHCRAPDDFEIVKVELLRNKVVWKRYQADKAARRELEAEKYAQRRMARMSGRPSAKKTQQGDAVTTSSPTPATPHACNPRYDAALKRQHEEACRPSDPSNIGFGGGSHPAANIKDPPKTAFFDAILFHGTSTCALPSILENGLDPRTTFRSCYGQGLYFSDTVEKCMHYVDIQDTFVQVYSILLCCVVLGNVLVNPFAKDQRQVNSDTLFLPPGFDSVCEMNPLKEFVVFEKTQVLPLCVISIKASNSPSSFWRICNPLLHTYPRELQTAHTFIHVTAPVTQNPVRITQPLVSTLPSPPGAGLSPAGGSLMAVFGAKPLLAVPPLDTLGVTWANISLETELATIGSLLNLQPFGIKKASCYLYGLLYTLIAGTVAWSGEQLIVRIPPQQYQSMLTETVERDRLEEHESIERKSRLVLEAATESRLRAEFDKNPAMHQLYPVGKTILMDMDKIKQELANFPAARQAILDASTSQFAHITQCQLQDIQRRNDDLLARQLLLLEDAKKFTLEQQQWIIAMVEEEAKLARMRQAHIDAGVAADHKLSQLDKKARQAASTMVEMTLDELAILVRIAENAKNTPATPFGNLTTLAFNVKSSIFASAANLQPFMCRTYHITCWEAEAWPQMLAEMLMSRVLISKIKPATFHLLLSQTRKVLFYDPHSQAVQFDGESGQRFVVAKNGWWYDAPRRHFQIPVAASRFWPVDPRSRLPNRSFQKLEDYLIWAITKTEKRKLTLSRNLEANSPSHPSLLQRPQPLSIEETLKQLEHKIQDGIEALDSSVRLAIAGLSAVSGRVVFSRQEMDGFLEQHVTSVISLLFEPATPDMLPQGSECSVCLTAFSSPASSTSATPSITYNKANGIVQLDADSRAVKLKCCRHCFHETCITSWFHAPSTILKCPVCSESCLPTLGRRRPQQGVDNEDEERSAVFPKLGPAPDGVMGYYFDPRMCAYYVWFTMPGHDTWSSTTTSAPMLARVPGENRFAIIPFSARLGPMLLIRMIVAFKFGHMFRVGRSLSRNMDNVVTWNGIHCRTDLTNRFGFGFPQPSYEANAWDELNHKHIAMRSDIVPTTVVGVGATNAQNDMFDREDDHEVEMEMFDCEYEEVGEVESLGASASCTGLSTSVTSATVSQQPAQQPPQPQREFDALACEHSKKIEEAVRARMSRGIPVDKAIEDVMNVVTGHNGSASREDQERDDGLLAYTNHQGFFDPKCPLMFG